MKSIVLTGGGTAGHALPHLAIYPYIKDSFDNFYYIGSYNGIERSLLSDKFQYFPITTTKLVRSLSLENLKIAPNLIKGTREAQNVLKKLQPSVIFSKGGYVAVPVALAANKLKIPVITHESDFSLGLANKIIAKKCDYVLTSFESVAKKLKNGVFTGPPVREFILNKQKALSYFGLSGKKPIILVIGGSSGSLTLNNAITGLLPDLLTKYDLVHLCGGKRITEKQDGYVKVGYLDDISIAYSVCDLAVSRAGAGVLFELLSLNIPALFIPLSKKISRGDQIINADYFYRKGFCNVLNEENLKNTDLMKKIDETFANADKYINNMKTYDNKCGNRKIADLLKVYGN